MSNAGNEGKIRLVRHSDSFWRVTFDLRPLNIFGPANIPQLEEVVSLMESDDRVKVVVFDSAIDGFFLTHYDFLAKPEESAKFAVGPTGRPYLTCLPD
jgi:enoyl-CoA hydratase/carnithine racemase